MAEKVRVMPTHIVAAAAVVENDKGEILMVKTHRGGWVFPGGQVEVGENLMDGVCREVLEETGVTIEVDELFCVASNTGKYPGYNGVKEIPTKVMLDFTGHYIEGQIRPSEENSQTAWIQKQDVLSMIEAPAIAERFRAYLEYTGRPIYLEYVTRPEYVLKLKRTL